MLNEAVVDLSSDEEEVEGPLNSTLEKIPVISLVKSLAPTGFRYPASHDKRYTTEPPLLITNVHSQCITLDKGNDGPGKVEEAPVSPFVELQPLHNKPGDVKKKRINPAPVPTEVSIMTADISPSPSSRELLNKFMKLCKEIDSSSDMTKILRTKVEKHYDNANIKYIASQDFKDLLMNLYSGLETSPKNCYVFIADLVSELRSRKANVKTQDDDSGPPLKKMRIEEGSSSVLTEDPVTYESLKRDKKIKTLDKTLRKLSKTIKRLEEREVDWDDECNSHYIMLQRFRERACKVFDKLCDYTSEPKDAGRVFKRGIIFRGKGCLSDPKFEKVNKCIGKYINSTGVFPDYADVLVVIKSANEEENLSLSQIEIEKIAKRAFIDIGDQLQRLRKDDDADTMLSLLGKANTSDPADDDPELSAKLEANKKHWGKINEIIEDFARQEKEKKKSDDDDNRTESNESEDDDDDEDDDDVDKEDNNAGDYLNSEREDKSSDEDTEDDDENGNQPKGTDSNADDQSEKKEGQTDKNDPEKEVESKRDLKQHHQDCTSEEVVSEIRENECIPLDKVDQRISISDIPSYASSNEQHRDRKESTNGECEKEIHQDYLGNEVCKKGDIDMLSETNISGLHKELDDCEIVILGDGNSNSAKFLSTPETLPKCEVNNDWDFGGVHSFVQVKEEYIPQKTGKIRVRSAKSLGGCDFGTPRRRQPSGIGLIDVIDID